MGKLGDAAKKIAPASDMYIKFEDGTELTLRLLGDPWIKSRRFEDTRTLDEDNNPTISVKTTFVWPVWDYAANKVRILEQGPGVARQIDTIDDKWRNDGTMPPNYDLTISATGNGLQRRYTVVPTPHQGTMPSTKSIEMPDMARMAGDGAVPLSDFLGGKEPDVVGEPATQKDATAKVKEVMGEDVVIEDLDTNAPINLDDIPF